MTNGRTTTHIRKKIAMDFGNGLPFIKQGKATTINQADLYTNCRRSTGLILIGKSNPKMDKKNIPNHRAPTNLMESEY